MKQLMAVARIMQLVITTMLLTLAYMLGIGLVSLIGKLFGKSFLVISPKHSSWSSFQHAFRRHTMY